MMWSPFTYISHIDLILLCLQWIYCKFTKFYPLLHPCLHSHKFKCDWGEGETCPLFTHSLLQPEFDAVSTSPHSPALIIQMREYWIFWGLIQEDPGCHCVLPTSETETHAHAHTLCSHTVSMCGINSATSLTAFLDSGLTSLQSSDLSRSQIRIHLL